MKWCEHCQKADHDDSECWSTRAVLPYKPVPMQSLAASMPPGEATRLAARLFEAYAKSRVVRK